MDAFGDPLRWVPDRDPLAFARVSCPGHTLRGTARSAPAGAQQYSFRVKSPGPPGLFYIAGHFPRRWTDSERRVQAPFRRALL